MLILPDAEEGQNLEQILPETFKVIVQLKDGKIFELESDLGIGGVLWANDEYKDYVNTEDKSFDLFEYFDGDVNMATSFLISPIIASPDRDVDVKEEKEESKEELSEMANVESKISSKFHGKVISFVQDKAVVLWDNGLITKEPISSLVKYSFIPGQKVLKSTLTKGSKVALSSDSKSQGTVDWVSDGGKVVVSWADGSKSVTNESDLIESSFYKKLKRFGCCSLSRV